MNPRKMRIKELLRDLEGTAKANGDTQSIINFVMDEVAEMEREISEYEVAINTAINTITTTNERLKKLEAKLGRIQMIMHTRT